MRRKAHASTGDIDGAEGARIGTRSDDEQRRRRAELRHLVTLLVKGAAQLVGQRALGSRGTRRLPRLAVGRDGAEREAATKGLVLANDGVDDGFGYTRGGEARAQHGWQRLGVRWPARLAKGVGWASAKRAGCRAWRRRGGARGLAFMEPGRDGTPSDADPPAMPAVADDFDVRDLDRELDRLLADPVPIGVTVGAALDRNERLERLVG